MTSASPSRYPVKVSVVLPTYNQSGFLSSAIQSILNQTYDNFELIIINDGSTDATETMLNTFKHPKLRIITQNNQGLPNALNNGFEMARGEYWTWTSTDNVVAPTWLEELANALDNAPKEIGYAFSYYAVMDDDDKILFINRDVRFDLPTLLTRHTGNASFLYRAELARKIGAYDSALIYAEDLDMWVRMAAHTRATLVETVLYYYRQHDNSMTFQREKVRNATRGVVTKFLARTDGKFDVDTLYPGITLSSDPAAERWKSRIDLIGKCANATYYCPVDAALDQLITAMNEHYDRGLAGNLVHLLAKEERWDEANTYIAKLAQSDRCDFFNMLMQIISQQDRNALQKIPFLTLEEKFIAADCKGPLTQDQLLKNLFGITSALQAGQPSFEALITRLVNQLEDFNDHPEIWQIFSSMQSPDEKNMLLQLKEYIHQLINVPQDSKALLLLKILEAVCLAYTQQMALAKSQLQLLNTQYPDIAAVKGALNFINHDESLQSPPLTSGA